MNLEEQIGKKISDFFSWINLPIVQNHYIKDLQNWDALCASLHIVNDLQRPKSEYYSLKSINHLESIGIIQTLYIEQDSIQTLKNAILENGNFSLNNYHNVRSIRNKVFGHPSAKNSGKIITRHFFDIMDKNKQLIKHIYWGTVEEIESENFTIADLVLENSKTTFAYLKEIEEDLKLKFNEIMNKYTVKFGDVFKGATYTF